MILNSVEADILEHLADGVPTSISDPSPEQSAALARLLDRSLIERLLVSRDGSLYGSMVAWRITDAGLMALQDQRECIPRNPDTDASPRPAQDPPDPLTDGDADHADHKHVEHQTWQRKCVPVLKWIAGIIASIIAAIAAARLLGWLGW